MIPGAFMFLLWISVFTAGQYLLTTTIEEKSNRVMEVLLSAASPMQLMLGKILGQMAVGGVLIRIGVEPNTELFRDQLPLDRRGYIIAGSEHETSLPNVFAIGDVANPLAPTISGATGAGATAAKVIAARLNAR